MYQNTPKSEKWLVNLEHTYIYSIKTLLYNNSVTKCTDALPTAFKSLHPAYASTFILQNTINILWYYLNFKVIIYRFHKFFKTYLMYITFYNIPLRRKTRSHRNHLQHSSFCFTLGKKAAAPTEYEVERDWGVIWARGETGTVVTVSSPSTEQSLFCLSVVLQQSSPCSACH